MKSWIYESGTEFHLAVRISTGWVGWLRVHERYRRQTDDTQTDRRTDDSIRSRSLKTNEVIYDPMTRYVEVTYSHEGLYTDMTISLKRCNIDTLLQQTINRKWYMAYWKAAIPMTLIEWLSMSFTHCKPFEMRFFVQSCSSWPEFTWHGTSRGPSAKSEPLTIRYDVVSVYAFFHFPPVHSGPSLSSPARFRSTCACTLHEVQSSS